MHENKYIKRENFTNYEYINKFLNKENNYSRQYAHVYFERLLIYRPLLLKYCKEKYGDKYEIKKIDDLKSERSSCIVIGTLYKQMALRPTILKKLANDYIPNEPVYGKFSKPSDVLFVEDELQRAQLTGNIPKENLVTGITIALICFEERGCLYVEDYIYPPLAMQIPITVLEKSKYIAIISGIGLSKQNLSVDKLELFIDSLNGQIEGDLDSTLAVDMSQISRLIIAGNSLNKTIYEENLLTRAKHISQKLSMPSFEYMKLLDDLIAQLATSINVDIMAGKNDPSNVMFPQQPLHKCMFPKSSKFTSFNTVSNPYEFVVDGIRFLGTSGQNVEDIYQYSEMEDRLEILENNLKWTHLAPTSPDSLPCYPYFNNEPFVITDCPHVYFAGNQTEFKWKYYYGERGQKVLLVTVPEFINSSTVVLINLKNLSCRSLTINTDF